MSPMKKGPNLAADHDVAIPYMQRSRDWYAAMGYSTPYRWAHLEQVPFTPLQKPLHQSSIAVITTAAPIRSGLGDQGPGARLNRDAAFKIGFSVPCEDAPELGISHLHYDRGHTKANDPRAFMPLTALGDAMAAGRVGSIAPRFHCTPTHYSHRKTMNGDGGDILTRLREDKTDAVILPAI